MKTHLRSSSAYKDRAKLDVGDRVRKSTYCTARIRAFCAAMDRELDEGRQECKSQVGNGTYNEALTWRTGENLNSDHI